MAKKLTKLQLTNRKAILDDPKQTIAKRTQAHLEIRAQMMNPKTDADFSPLTFDPMEGVRNHDIIKRTRMAPLRRLPNPHGMQPKEILEGQMIGMFESKQDLYLLLVWLSGRVSDLEDEVNTLKGG